MASEWSGSWIASQLPLNQIEATASNVRNLCYVIKKVDPSLGGYEFLRASLECISDAVKSTVGLKYALRK